jgi:hypothetical protein
VEHVLPQNPPVGSQWVTWFPKEDERPKVVHKLGNLALLSRRKNSQAQNFDFDRKKREYFSKNGVSPFALTTQVLNENVWTLDVIRNRQQLLVDKLKGLWRL